MPTTPARAYPYPANNDSATVPADLQAALGMVDADMQNAIDNIGARVIGDGVKNLWAGTQEAYDGLSPDPQTIYIITNATQDGGGDGGQALGIPATSSLATSSATSIIPTLPSLAQEWGYLAIIVGQITGSGLAWTAPAGWTRIADQSLTDGGFSARPMGIFKAPKGTSTMAFSSPYGGAQRYAAAIFPVALEPQSRGFVDAQGASMDFFTAPSMVYGAAAIPITIATSNYGDVSGASLPTMSNSLVNVGSGSAITSGQGNATILHIAVGSEPVMATPSQGFTLSEPMASNLNAWRFGLGS